MVHGRWSDVLFLHWRIPPGSPLERIIQVQSQPFALDRYPDPRRQHKDTNNDGDICDDNADVPAIWIGLILLTEEQVGPSIGRFRWTCINHRVATMSRRETDVCLQRLCPTKEKSDAEQGATCVSTTHRQFQMQSERLHPGNPSWLRLCYRTFWNVVVAGIAGKDKLLLHSTSRTPMLTSTEAREDEYTKSVTLVVSGTKCRHSTDDSEKPRRSKGFSVECTWTLESSCSSAFSPKASCDEDPDFAQWAMERYHVYTHAYGWNWKGEVHHEPWPVYPVCQLDYLVFSDISNYEPKEMRPVLRFMAENRPNSILFSPGVGPVRFQMLQPVHDKTKKPKTEKHT